MTISVAIAGATGIVGQKLIALLHNNKKFHVSELSASDKCIDNSFESVCEFQEPMIDFISDRVRNIKMKSVNDFESEFVISCLPSDVASTLEPIIINKKKILFSNSSNFRMHDNIPLLIPEINGHTLSLIDKQNTIGKVITNPNCIVSALSICLAPIVKNISVKHISVFTMQSLSGAGRKGLFAMDICGNIIPHIDNETEKIQQEIRKIFKDYSKYSGFSMTVSVNRVPILWGHMINVHMICDDKFEMSDIIKYIEEWNIEYNDVIAIHHKLGRPNILSDLKHDDMRVHIGGLRLDNNSLSFSCLSNNLVRGAAGAVIANMEYFLSNY